jgi:hypothetical protein
MCLNSVEDVLMLQSGKLIFLKQNNFTKENKLLEVWVKS